MRPTPEPANTFAAPRTTRAIPPWTSVPSPSGRSRSARLRASASASTCAVAWLMRGWYVARGVPWARSPTDVAVTPAAPGSSRVKELCGGRTQRRPRALRRGMGHLAGRGVRAPRRRGAGTGHACADPRLPPGDVRRREHRRGDLRARAGRPLRRGSRSAWPAARVSCDGSSSSLTWPIVMPVAKTPEDAMRALAASA